MPNFSSLAGLELTEKFVCGGGGWVGYKWQQCLTFTFELLLVEFSSVELLSVLTTFLWTFLKSGTTLSLEGLPSMGR